MTGHLSIDVAQHDVRIAASEKRIDYIGSKLDAIIGLVITTLLAVAGTLYMQIKH